MDTEWVINVEGFGFFYFSTFGRLEGDRRPHTGSSAVGRMWPLLFSWNANFNLQVYFQETHLRASTLSNCSPSWRCERKKNAIILLKAVQVKTKLQESCGWKLFVFFLWQWLRSRCGPSSLMSKEAVELEMFTAYVSLSSITFTCSAPVLWQLTDWWHWCQSRAELERFYQISTRSLLIQNVSNMPQPCFRQSAPEHQ